jgi:hypothetical protein
MKTRSACRCLLCQLEFHLRRHLHEVSCEEAYSKVASTSWLLSGFPSAFALTAHLRACRSDGSGSHPADAVLAEILHLRLRDAGNSLLRDVLLLAFIPVLHSAARQVARLYPSLVGDDTAQHLITAFLEALESPELVERDSHFPFAISRMVRRSVFDWAERETRSQGNGEFHEHLSELPATSAIPEQFERTVLLRHFLFRCHRDGLLTGPDLELLVHIKLEGNFGDRNGASPEYSNALRQKIKRLLRKLREAAHTPCRTLHD